MKFITLSGVDGSGKSTQLQALKQSLESEGHKVFYFHAIEFSLANKISRVLQGKKEFIPGAEKSVTKASAFSLFLRKQFLLIDIVRFRLLLKSLRRERYDYIISDRYFYDSVINILYLTHKDSSTYSYKQNMDKQHIYTEQQLLLERFIPKPDLAFYFQITADDIMKRSRVPDQGVAYLRKKIALFEQKKEAFGMISVDASQDARILTQLLLLQLNKE